MDATAISLIWPFLCGGSGGAANTLVSRNFRFLPAIETRAPGPSRLPVLGLVGNVALGSAAALLAWTTIGGQGPVPCNEIGTILSSLVYAGIGFLSSRASTAEFDKAILRRAVGMAATAPAASPETVRTLYQASPEQIYDIVDSLMPHRAEHR